MPLTTLATIPILRIFDEAKAREFYLDFLGFKIDFEHRFGPNFPLYMQVSLGDCVLHLSEHHGDACPGARVFIRVTGLEEFQKSLLAKDYRYMKPGLDKTPWGSITTELADPFGNRLTFDEKIGGPPA